MATGDEPVYIQRHGKQFQQRDEAAAGTDIIVGDLLEVSGEDEVQPHATAGGAVGETLVAINFRGRGMTKTDLNQYAAGDNVHYVACNGGGVYLRLAAGTSLTTAANATAAPGDKLVSNGDGTVVVQSDEPDSAVVAEVPKDGGKDNSSGDSFVFVKGNIV